MDHSEKNSAQEKNLSDYLQSESSTRVFIVGHLPAELLDWSSDIYRVEHFPNIAAAELKAAEYREEERSPTNALISLVLQLENTEQHVQQLLGRAVRAFPHRVLVHVQQSADLIHVWDASFFALGFRRLALGRDSNHSHQSLSWFEYRLSHYKSEPDWLNSRFWANPERFDIEASDDYYDQFEDDEEE